MELYSSDSETTPPAANHNPGEQFSKEWPDRSGGEADFGCRDRTVEILGADRREVGGHDGGCPLPLSKEHQTRGWRALCCRGALGWRYDKNVLA
jgi:hypothetical protein